MVWLEKVELDHGVHQQQGGPQHPPQGNVAGERLGDGGPAKLDTNEELGDNDGNHDPGLSSKLVTIRVIKQLESFSQTCQKVKV